MNKIRVPGIIWLASDMHLGPDTPRTREVFYAFLEQACVQADALFLCGDIFDVWIGDDAALVEPPAWLADTVHALLCTAKEIPLWLARGNRDFLLGQALTKHIGAHLLTEPTLLATTQGDVLVAHGDEYCTDDISYQRFKKLVRNPFVQKAYLSLGLAQRRRIAQYARRRSMSSHGSKPYDIMDVTPHAIRTAFEQTGATSMVHGHTHRPKVHTVHTDTGVKHRYVLPDWECDHEPMRGGWLSISDTGIALHSLHDLSIKPANTVLSSD